MLKPKPQLALLSREALDQALLDAHEKRDGSLLASLYEQASTLATQQGDADAEAFYLTQAFVYALEVGSMSRHAINRRLHALGRDHLQTDL